MPNANVAYGHLTDTSITAGVAAGDPARESVLCLAHDDATLLSDAVAKVSDFDTFLDEGGDL